MSKNSETKKSKLTLTLIIILGIIAIFAYSILSKGGVTLKKSNFTGALNKQVAMVDEKIQKNIVAVKEKISEGKNNIEKVKGKSEKSELENIRAEVQRSKDATVVVEKLATEELKRETIKANKKEPTDAKDNQTKEQEQTNLAALAKVNAGLGEAYSQVESPKEQQIISKMRSTVSKLEDNPSYDSSSDQASVKESYSKLDEDSKSRIKIVLFTNIDGESIGQLKKTFGL